MEVRFCQYCGSRLNEEGVCEHCAAELAAEEAADGEVIAQSVSEGTENIAKVEKNQIESPRAQIASEKPEGQEVAPVLAIPDPIMAVTAPVAASAEQPQSQSKGPKKRRRVGLILGIIGGVLVIAAAVVFFVWFNPRDSAHFDAAKQAREAGDWTTAKQHYEAISPQYYYSDWVAQWLVFVDEKIEEERILREENPNDIALFNKADAAWNDGRLYDAQTEYSQISKTFYNYGVVEDRLRILSENRALVELTRGTWSTMSDNKNCAVIYTSKKCRSYGHFSSYDIGWNYGFSGGKTETGDKWNPYLSATVRVILTTTGSSTIKVTFDWPVFSPNGSSATSNLDNYSRTSEKQTLIISASRFGSEATVNGVNNIPFQVTVTDSYIDITVDYGFTGTSVNGHSRVCFYK